MILEDIDGSRKEITIINENGIASVAIKKENESIPEIEFLALDIAKRFQEIEYMNFTFAVSEQKITTVSYTHLDVYKRQLIHLLELIYFSFGVDKDKANWESCLGSIKGLNNRGNIYKEK